MVTESRCVCLERYDERYGYLRLPRPRQEEALGASMRRYGQLTPIVAAERGESFAVVDGFKRLHSARKIGLEMLDGRVFSLSEQAAIGAVYSLNQHGRGLVDLEEAMVVRELCREHGMSSATLYKWRAGFFAFGVLVKPTIGQLRY